MLVEWMIISKYTQGNEERGAGTQIPKKFQECPWEAEGGDLEELPSPWSLLPGEVRELALTSRQGVSGCGCSRSAVHVDSPEEPLASQEDVSRIACLPDGSELASRDQKKTAPGLLMKVKFPSTNGAAGDVQGGLSKVHGRVLSSRSFKFIHQSRKLPTWTLLRENPLGKSPSQKVILELCTKKNLVSVEKEHWGNFNYNEVRSCEILQSPVKTTELLTFPFLLWLLGNSSIAVTFFFF